MRQGKLAGRLPLGRLRGRMGEAIAEGTIVCSGGSGRVGVRSVSAAACVVWVSLGGGFVAVTGTLAAFCPRAPGESGWRRWGMRWTVPRLAI